MKEIKDFMKMMEKILRSDQFNYDDDSNESNRKYLRRQESLMMSPEYKALKAIADKPVSKMEITDDMIHIAWGAYNIGRITRKEDRIKAALEAFAEEVMQQEVK